MFGVSCTKDQAQPPASPSICEGDTISYQNHIKPILDVSCIGSSCHSDIGMAGGISLEDYADVKVIADNGKFLCTIKGIGILMPPAPVPPLDSAQIQQVECWIEQGALDN